MSSSSAKRKFLSDSSSSLFPSEKKVKNNNKEEEEASSYYLDEKKPSVIFIHNDYLKTSSSKLFRTCNEACDPTLQFQEFPLLDHPLHIWLHYLATQEKKSSLTIEEKVDYADFLYWVDDENEINLLLKDIALYLLVDVTTSILIQEIRSSIYWDTWILPELNKTKAKVWTTENADQFIFVSFTPRPEVLKKIGHFVVKHNLKQLSYHLLRIISQLKIIKLEDFILECGLTKQWISYSHRKHSLRNNDISFMRGELVILKNPSRGRYEVVIINDVKSYISSPIPRPTLCYHLEFRFLEQKTQEEYNRVEVDRNCTATSLNHSLFPLNGDGIESWMLFHDRWLFNTLNGKSDFQDVMRSVLEDVSFLK